MIRLTLASCFLVLSLLLDTAAFASTHVTGGVIEGPAPRAEGATLPHPVKRVAGPSSDLVDRVIEESGTRKQLEELVNLSSADEAFSRLFRKYYHVEEAEQATRKQLAQRLSETELLQLLKWLESPAGKRITAAESAPEPDDTVLQEFTQKDHNPDRQERLRLLLGIDRVAGQSEVEHTVITSTFKKMAAALPADFPDKAAKVDDLLKSVQPLEKLREENAPKSAYTYRGISTDELWEYLQFLKSPVGVKYSAALTAADVEMFDAVLGKVVDVMGKAISEQLAYAKISQSPTATPEEMCRAYAEADRRKLPIKLDSIVTITGVRCEAATVVYQCAVPDVYASQVTKNAAKVEAGIKYVVCGNEEIRESHLKKGVSVRYGYQDESGNFLKSFQVNPEDCRSKAPGQAASGS